jgi:hypothetical protein
MRAAVKSTQVSNWLRMFGRRTDNPAALVPICAHGKVEESRANTAFFSLRKQFAEHFCAHLCPRQIARIDVSLRFYLASPTERF